MPVGAAGARRCSPIAGALINDPKLYNNLVEATRQMGQLMKEMRELVNKWKEQGLFLKLQG